MGQQEHLRRSRTTPVGRSGRPESRHQGRLRKRLRRRPERLRPAGILRPYQLRLQGTLPRRSERPLRRNVAFRLKQPLGLVSLGIGGLAYLGGTLLRPCEERGRQPQTARLVRFAGQPERSVLLPQPAAGHAPAISAASPSATAAWANTPRWERRSLPT